MKSDSRSLSFPLLLVLLFFLPLPLTAADSTDLEVVVAPWQEEDLARRPIGDFVRYSLVVRNNGPSVVETAKLTIEFPPEIEVRGVFSGSDGTCAGSAPIVCTLRAAFASVHVDTRMPLQAGRVTVKASVESALPDPAPSNNILSITTELVAVADVGVSIERLPDLVSPGQELEFRAVVSNDAGIPARDVVFTVTMPEGTEIARVAAGPAAGWECKLIDYVMRCTVDELSPLSSLTLDMFGTAPDDPSGGLFRFEARASTTSPVFEPERLTASKSLLMTREIEVTTTADSGPGSLRWAIETASASCSGFPPCRIRFAITPPVPLSGWFTIRPETPLPPLRACATLIDGMSQTHVTGETNADGAEIEIDGSLLREGNGLVVQPVCTTQPPAEAPPVPYDRGVTIEHLAVHSFPENGIAVPPVDAGSGRVALGFLNIGVDPSGRTARGNGLRGVSIASPSTDLSIYRSVISGNGRSGVFLWSSRFVFISQTAIGTASDRVTPLANGASGVYAGTNSYDVSIRGSVIAWNREFGLAFDAGKMRVGHYDTSFFGNGHLAIDGGLDGPTPNDVDESDGVWNHPVLTSAKWDEASGTTIVKGVIRTIVASVDPSWVVQLFADNMLPETHGSHRPLRGATAEFRPPFNALRGAPFEAEFEIAVKEDLSGARITAVMQHGCCWEYVRLTTSELSPAIVVE